MIDHLRRGGASTGSGLDKCGVLRRARLSRSTRQERRPMLFKVTPAAHSPLSVRRARLRSAIWF